MAWNFLFQLAVTIVSSAILRRQQKRAAERARNEALDASAVEVRPEYAGEPVPLLYGFGGVRGIIAYTETIDSQPLALYRGNEVDAAAFPGGKRTAGQVRNRKDGGRGRGPAGGAREFLFAQLVIGIGQLATFAINLPVPIGGSRLSLNDVTNASGVAGTIAADHTTAHMSIGEVWMEGYSDRERTPQYDTEWQLTTPAFGVARQAITTIYPERTSESRFRGFARMEIEAWFARGINVWGATPAPFVAVLGRVLPDITAANELAADLTFSSNPIRVLLDYMIGGVEKDEMFGPRVPVAEIDLASFRAAITLAATGGPTDLLDDGDEAPPPPSPNFQSLFGRRFATWLRYFILALNRPAPEPTVNLNRMNDSFRGALTVGRYHFDGQISSETDYREATRRILDAVPGAYLFWSLAGRWKVSVPDPDLDLTKVPTIGADILTALPVRTWPDVKDRLNGAKGRFVNANLEFAQDVVEFPATWELRTMLLAEDGGRPLRETIDLPGASNPVHAYSRLATHVFLSRRPSYRWETTIVGLVYEPGDVVRLDPGLWSAHVRISAWELTERNTIAFEGTEFVPTDFRFQQWPAPTSPLRFPPALACRGLSNAELRTASSVPNLISVAYGNGKVFVLDVLLNVWAFDAGTGKRVQAHDISRSTVRSAMRRFSPDGMAATDDDVVRLVDSQRDVIYGFRAGARHAAADVSAATLRAYAGENDSPVQPVDIAVTGAGALLVADSSNEVIWRDGAVYVPTSAFDAFAGEQPAAVAASGSDVYVLITRFGSRDQASIHRVAEAADGNTLTPVFPRTSFSAPMGDLDLNGLAARPGCVYVGNAHEDADEVLALDTATVG